jgi:hypothetical protein
MQGKSLNDLASISAAVLEAAVDGLPSESKHAAHLAVDALRALLRKHGH